LDVTVLFQPLMVCMWESPSVLATAALSALPNPQSPIPNPQSAISTPNAVRGLELEVKVLSQPLTDAYIPLMLRMWVSPNVLATAALSALHNPQSPIPNPQSAIRNLHAERGSGFGDGG